MRSPIAALSWDIWQRNRRIVGLVIGILLFGWLLNLAVPGSLRTLRSGNWLEAANAMLLVISLVCVFGIFSFTEFNPQKHSIGYPHRLFVLPVTSLQLVIVPLSLGVAGVEVVYLAWRKLVFDPGNETNPGLSAVLAGGYMVIYQTILWSCPGLRSLRMVVAGGIAAIFIGVAFLPSFPQQLLRPWLSEPLLISAVAGTAFVAFLVAWMVVARQRCGAEFGHYRVKTLIRWIVDAVPRRTRSFASPSAAQFWFEWRRSGSLLPLCIGVLLVLVIGPLSWYLRDETAGTLRILVATLAMPVILAAPVGKGFSKPDLWSTDLSLPDFVAVRPLPTGEMVIIKMKVAALSAALSWLLVLAFLSVWLPLWADLEEPARVRWVAWQAYGHAVYPQYAIAVLSVIAGVLLTWKGLVGSLWLGLSGNRRLFAISVAPYALTPLVLIGLSVVADYKSPIRVWIGSDPDGLISFLVWLAALAVIAKFWLAVFSWRNISSRRVRQYCAIWLGSTICLAALAILLWVGARYFLPFDTYRLRNVLILVALLLMPLARLGIAPSSLAKNRHR